MFLHLCHPLHFENSRFNTVTKVRPKIFVWCHYTRAIAEVWYSEKWKFHHSSIAFSQVTFFVRVSHQQSRQAYFDPIMGRLANSPLLIPAMHFLLQGLSDRVIPLF
jgi:hypothetical protein